MESMRRKNKYETIALSLFIHIPTPANTTRMPLNTTPYKLVNEFCNQAKNKTLRVETFKLDPRRVAPDEVTLVKVAIDLGISGVSKLKSHVSLVLPKHGTNPFAKLALQSCVSSFGVASEFLRGAQICVGPSDEDSYETASENILSASYSVESCQRGWILKGSRSINFSVVTSTSRVIGFAFGITNNVPTPPLNVAQNLCYEKRIISLTQA
ncbi:hypothetical protein LOK49_LG06G02274 [Camellia lanceoleosa]|uniref:Uncharacterized protein n=1 Tax=Camellia lanceoleosa TaxID=1840588 RepID=A0ACC0HB08_9ERIC|nr:hypothetical protein LOK49_LG06G02274 [Camellia lanceoleosa]